MKEKCLRHCLQTHLNKLQKNGVWSVTQLLSGDKQEYALNWRNELIAYLSNAASNKIKGNNSVLSREKAISEVWVKEKEYSTDTNVINLTIHAKFQSEAIATNTKIYQQVLSDCANDAKNIIKVIAEASPEEITQYVSNI